MKNERSQTVPHRMIAAGLAKLMQLSPPGKNTHFTVASASVDEGDPAIEQLMRSAAASRIDLLLAIIERRHDGTRAYRLMLIESTTNVTRGIEVDPVCIAVGEPALLVDVDRREAWQYRSGHLTPVEVPPTHVVARGIKNAIANIDHLIASAAPVAAQLRLRELAPYRKPTHAC
jgi:hypothetical protein